MQLFTTEQNVLAAWNITQNMGKEDKSGYDAYYGEAEHLSKLAQCGFNSTKEFQAAVEKADWYIAYDNAMRVMKLLDHKSDEYRAMVQEMRDAEMWDEEDHRTQGLQLWIIAQQTAPKQSQLVALVGELGLKWPNMTWR